MHGGVHVGKTLQQATLAAVPPAGRRRPLQTHRSIWHPPKIIQLHRKTLKNISVKRVINVIKDNSGITCELFTAACCADALKITMVTKYVSSDVEVKDFGKPVRLCIYKNVYYFEIDFNLSAFILKCKICLTYSFKFDISVSTLLCDTAVLSPYNCWSLYLKYCNTIA